MIAEHELEIISIIAKALKAQLPSMPMDCATRYAKAILEALHGEDWLL